MTTAAPSKPSADFWVGLFSPVIIAGYLLIIAPMVILKAWVITILWGWYIVPAFGLAPLRMVYAFGLALLVSYLTFHYTEDKRGFWAKLGFGLFSSVMVLLVGWIGTFFI